MKFIIGKDRSQIPLFVSSLDEAIDQDNEVRLIDLYVNCFYHLKHQFKIILVVLTYVETIIADFFKNPKLYKKCYF